VELIEVSLYSVVADVGQTLVQLLRDNMVPDLIQQPEYIGLAAPADKGDLTLSLFLYKVTESVDRQTQMISRGAGAQQFPPMTVDLFYMLTAHSNAELLTRSLDEHRILGRAMQVMYDNAILQDSVLQGSLAGTNEQPKIVMDSLPMDTMISLFPNLPYKLSVCYSVGPVQIDSTRIRATKRVLERDFRLEG
jgi:hypothetical protein